MSKRVRFSDQQRQQYLRSGSRQVEGWLMTCDKFLVATLGDIQREEGIGGGICEIGVHHGKLFILLYLYLNESEAAVAVDLFERQELNIDHSGHGNRRQFLANIETHAGSDAPLHIIAGDSTALDAAAIIERAGRIRLFSIDGGHTAEITRSDLALAEACLHEWGVIILDDCFNQSWPGVSDGVHAHFHAGGSALAPFAIARNKVFFCHREKAPAYRRQIAARKRQCLRDTQEFLGVDVDIYDGYDSISNILAMTRLHGLSKMTGKVHRMWQRGLDRMAFLVEYGT